MNKMKSINNKVDCHRLIAQVITLDNLHSIKRSFYEKLIEYLDKDILYKFRVVLILFSHLFYAPIK